MATCVLPATLAFAPTFQSVLRVVAETAYPQLRQTPLADAYADRDDFNGDLANAISETLGVLGIDEHPEAGDWLGDLYDLAAQIGIVWNDPA